ncbi:hypothetical protein D3C74_21180 [compost metagenome]
MKKLAYTSLIACMALLVGLFSFTPLTSAASAKYSLHIDGKVITGQPPVIVENNTTLVPMKAVLTQLGYTMTVDSKTKAITAKNTSGSSIIVKTGSKKATINGSEVVLPALVKTVNGTTYIPLSAIRSLTGKAIGLDSTKGFAWIGDKPAANDSSMPWSMSQEELKTNSAQKQLIDEGGQGDISLLLYQDSLEAGEAEELYVFYKNKLAAVVFTPVVPDYDPGELISFYAGMYHSLATEYGEPVAGSSTPNPNNISEYVARYAVEGRLSSEWIKDGTKVTLLLKATTDTAYTMSLQYVDMSVEEQLNAAWADIQNAMQ